MKRLLVVTLFVSTLVSPAFCAKEDSFISFCCACKKGDHKTVREMVNKNDNLIRTTDADGDTPLAYAVDGQNIDVVEFLVRQGAEVNVVDNNGITPLMMAVYLRDYDLVKTLLNWGADTDVVDNNGTTPCMYAIGYNVGTDILVLLLEYGAKVKTQNVRGMPLSSYFLMTR